MYDIVFQIVAIFLMISAGFFARRRKVIDETFNQQLAKLLMNLFYPCLILSAMLKNFTIASLLANWTLPAGCAMIMITGWCLGRLVLPLLRHRSSEFQRSFHFQCTMNNYSFLPIMLMSGFIGPQAVALVIFASLGAELVMWTLGVQALTGKRISRQSCRNLLSMPMAALGSAMLLLTIHALLTQFNGSLLQPHPVMAKVGDMLLRTCQKIGEATIPVAAIICGSRLATLQAEHLFTPPLVGLLGMRLLIIPAVALTLLTLLPLTTPVWQVLLIIAAQPCSMTSVSLTCLYKTDEHLAAAAVFVTHIACLATIPFWWQVAGGRILGSLQSCVQ
jgi:predicted permease